MINIKSSYQFINISVQKIYKSYRTNECCRHETVEKKLQYDVVVNKINNVPCLKWVKDDYTNIDEMYNVFLEWALKKKPFIK